MSRITDPLKLFIAKYLIPNSTTGVIPKSEERGADNPLRSSSSEASFVIEAVTSSVANAEARPLKTDGGGKDEDVVAMNKDSMPLTISFQVDVTQD